MPKPIISGPYKTFRPLKQNETFIEFEGSVITIPLTAEVPDSAGALVRKTEDIALSAFMRLEVMPAYVNGLGTREFQFIIRDWDLFGTCPLLNELFFGNREGRPRNPTAEDSRRYQTAHMTFCLSRNFVKYGDDNGQQLGHPDALQIDNLTAQDFPDGYIYWQIDPPAANADGPGLRVRFHNKSPDVPGADVDIDTDANPRDIDRIVAESFVRGDPAADDGGVRNAPFTASLSTEVHAGKELAFSRGNSVISDLIRPRHPVEIKWKLGAKPEPGKGRIRIVSPPKSLCTAHQGPSVDEKIDQVDFPARIVYAASYHVFVNNVRFVEDQAGIAIADGVHEIPPRDITVAFEKPHSGRVLGKFLGFGPGHCTGMHEIPEDEYRRGVEFARFCRTRPLQPEL